MSTHPTPAPTIRQEPAPGDDSLASYEYHLPASRIAQRPADRRDDARLMLLERRGVGLPADHRVRDLPALLRGDELLVLNDTRVVPARLRGRKVPTGGAVELLVVEADDPGRREVVVMARSSKKLKPGALVDVGGGEGGSDGAAVVRVVESLGGGHYRVALPTEAPNLHDFLERFGDLPLPPYIERAGGVTAEDAARYQTTFARTPGAVAAPTAGLHFTPALLDAIRARGCDVATVTLHVGPGTFQPVRVADLSAHQMHAERFVIPPETAVAVARARAEGRPVLAVGTTVVRALEAAAAQAPAVSDAPLRPGPGETALFIRPGYTFRVVDQLMTNFHLPGSTLLMLVSALVGRARLLDAYSQAIARGYRFYSYGDGMLLR